MVGFVHFTSVQSLGEQAEQQQDFVEVSLISAIGLSSWLLGQPETNTDSASRILDCLDNNKQTMSNVARNS